MRATFFHCNYFTKIFIVFFPGCVHIVQTTKNSQRKKNTKCFSSKWICVHKQKQNCERKISKFLCWIINLIKVNFSRFFFGLENLKCKVCLLKIKKDFRMADF